MCERGGSMAAEFHHAGETAAELRRIAAALETEAFELVLYQDADKQHRLKVRRAGRSESKATSISARFRKFHDANPNIFAAIIEYLEAARRGGQSAAGMKAIIEGLRWNRVKSAKVGEGWKIPNDFTSRYARLVIERRPDLAEMLEIRELRTI